MFSPPYPSFRLLSRLDRLSPLSTCSPLFQCLLTRPRGLIRWDRARRRCAARRIGIVYSNDSDYDGAYDYDDQPFMRRPWSEDCAAP
jgi:hypothetical protein